MVAQKPIHKSENTSLSAFEGLQREAYRFTAKEWDEETKLYYMSARYQNPMTSRWMCADPAGPSLINPNRRGLNLIESVNWYSYCGNNPIKYSDPTGLKTQEQMNADAEYSRTHGTIAYNMRNNKNSDSGETVDDRVTDGSMPELPEEGPCMMRALQGVAETYAGKNLSEDNIKSSITDLQGGEDPAMESDFNVLDPKAIIKDALTLLGVDTDSLDINISRPGDSDYKKTAKKATASLRGVRALNTPSATSPTHWQEGNSSGGLVFDPISGSSGGGRKNFPAFTRFITINPRKDD